MEDHHGGEDLEEKNRLEKKRSFFIQWKSNEFWWGKRNKWFLEVWWYWKNNSRENKRHVTYAGTVMYDDPKNNEQNNEYNCVIDKKEYEVT